ncbi:uncharacterized protein LOC113309938 [Papaver somniferum]|uniref:uncharacterized protein LOC113309938 n=1 Tax=Papaver somniferum TaxID=3469 RepID=UPI000E703F04|nr:uncharacterized protein LOC113309938 [Papaver somniferum]
MSKPRTKYATNMNHSSDDDPGLVEAIRNRTGEVQEQSEASRIAHEEEMGRISDEEEGDEEGDKEIRELFQEQEGYPKGKGQKKEVPKKKKGDHMPDDLKMLARGPDDPPSGIPADGGNVLWDYKGSWAGVVYNTIPGMSVSKMRQWPLIADELSRGEVPEVVDLVNSTGLLSVVNNLSHLTYDRPLCSAFAERYYGETDTLHLPSGKMTITSNDAKFITELSIEGKAVKHKDYGKSLIGTRFMRGPRKYSNGMRIIPRRRC